MYRDLDIVQVGLDILKTLDELGELRELGVSERLGIVRQSGRGREGKFTIGVGEEGIMSKR